MSGGHRALHDSPGVPDRGTTGGEPDHSVDLSRRRTRLGRIYVDLKGAMVSRSTRDLYVTPIIGVAALFHAGSGLWAVANPQSFYDVIATYPPYHSHFIRDIGAFLLGLGAVLIGALVWRDVAFVVLLGGTVASGFHWVSHLIDRHHGGTGADPWLTGLFALLLLAGLVLRAPARHGDVPADVSSPIEEVRQ